MASQVLPTISWLNHRHSTEWTSLRATKEYGSKLEETILSTSLTKLLQSASLFYAHIWLSVSRRQPRSTTSKLKTKRLLEQLSPLRKLSTCLQFTGLCSSITLWLPWMRWLSSSPLSISLRKVHSASSSRWTISLEFTLQDTRPGSSTSLNLQCLMMLNTQRTSLRCTTGCSSRPITCTSLFSWCLSLLGSTPRWTERQETWKQSLPKLKIDQETTPSMSEAHCCDTCLD